MGPMPTRARAPRRLPNLFRIRPLLPPAGNEWIVLNERSISPPPTSYRPRWPERRRFRRRRTISRPASYQFKLELFDAAGRSSNGQPLASTCALPSGRRLAPASRPRRRRRRPDPGGRRHLGFRMVVRVDNNRCFAEILPVGGTVTPDPICGFHNTARLRTSPRFPSLRGIRITSRPADSFDVFVRGSDPSHPVTNRRRRR